MKKYIVTRKILLLFFLFLSCISTFGQSDPACMPAWKDEANAVVLFKNELGTWCSGALVNTTAGANNNRHFLLTSTMAVSGSGSDLSNYTFYWHYEKPYCNTSNGPVEITTQGAKVVAKIFCNADLALIELNKDPAEAWDVTPYYLGWDRSDDIVTGTTLIYHPRVMRDIKKIIIDNNTTLKTIYDPYWSIKIFNAYDSEDPGSGAPLLNWEHKLIGNYHHGYCDGVCYDYYYFSRFDVAWGEHDQYINYCTLDSTSRLKDWLDPINTGQMILDGRAACQKTIRLWHSLPRAEYHAVDSIISKQEIPKNSNVSYKAGTEIVLQDGFHASSGSTFTAQIETLDCNGASSPLLTVVNACEPPTNLEVEIVNCGAAITWEAPEITDGLQGYNIYRDGAMLNEEPVSETTYLDTELENGTYAYKVSTMYDYCEESFADEVSVDITCVGINDYLTASYKLYPNPAKNELNIEIYDMRYAICDVEIYDVYGRISYISNLKSQVSSLKIDISQLASGMYFVKIISEQGSVIKKVAVE